MTTSKARSVVQSLAITLVLLAACPGQSTVLAGELYNTPKRIRLQKQIQDIRAWEMNRKLKRQIQRLKNRQVERKLNRDILKLRRTEQVERQQTPPITGKPAKKPDVKDNTQKKAD
jgi:hypothetical protein